MIKSPWFAAVYVLFACSFSRADSLTVTPSVIREGSTVSIQFREAGSTCFPGTPQSYTLTFGDGTLSQSRGGTCGTDDSFTTSHVYANNNSSNTFRLTCGTTSAFVTVTNVPPSILPIASFYAMAGQTVSNWVSFTDPGLDNHTATLDYGDGSPPQVVDVWDLRNFR